MFRKIVIITGHHLLCDWLGLYLQARTYIFSLSITIIINKDFNIILEFRFKPNSTIKKSVYKIMPVCTYTHSYYQII